MCPVTTLPLHPTCRVPKRRCRVRKFLNLRKHPTIGTRHGPGVYFRAPDRIAPGCWVQKFLFFSTQQKHLTVGCSGRVVSGDGVKTCFYRISQNHHQTHFERRPDICLGVLYDSQSGPKIFELL